MHLTRRLSAAVLAWFVMAMPATATSSDDAAWAALKDGSVVLFRHAQAPGVGDPPGFNLGDCGTQRNLDDTGRAQARRIGERFRHAGVKVGIVLTSQWCRTRETAELAFPGQARDDADFNSFFGDSTREAEQTVRALATLSRWRGPGVLVVVTHQVNITALTGNATQSGEGLVVAPRGSTATVLERLRP